MFGCCNNLFSSSCRCHQGCNRSCGCGQNPIPPAPTPIFPPMPTPTPQPVTPQLRGLEATLTAGSGGTVANGFPIPFNDLISNNVLGASFVTGAVTLTRPGTYLVNWWVALDPSDLSAADSEEQTTTNDQVTSELSFAVALNGDVLSGSYAPEGIGQMGGSAFVTVQSAPSALQIVNNSGENVLLAETTVQAGMTVTQLA